MPPKRNKRAKPTNIYRERVETLDDFDIDVIPSREEHVLSSGRVAVVDYSPGKGRSDWSRTQEWVMEDEANSFVLDPSSEQYDALLEADIFDAEGPDMSTAPEGRVATKQKRKSMRAGADFGPETAEYILEVPLQRYILTGTPSGKGQSGCTQPEVLSRLSWD
ncbi:hypothetical protein VNI00_018004 [Paramarasmius palmivorus]|uniref:Uncharacterized protein n=1 Tax=Paramarasmius palmivorus TaxID=297713 RepID=A0AAW0B1X6_9AGAR